jgi:hypothetical protein
VHSRLTHPRPITPDCAFEPQCTTRETLHFGALLRECTLQIAFLNGMYRKAFENNRRYVGDDRHDRRRDNYPNSALNHAIRSG